MKRSIVAAALFAAASASPVQAQSASPVHFGLAAGGTVPTGDLADIEKFGYHVTGIGEISPIASPIGVRLDLMYNALTGKDVDIFGKAPDLGLVTANLNGVFNLGAGSMSGVRPYVIGGVGLYNYKVTDFVDDGDIVTTNTSRETKFGLNGGIGFRFDLSGFSTFVEARFHNVFVDEANIQFIPISFGIMF